MSGWREWGNLLLLIVILAMVVFIAFRNEDNMARATGPRFRHTIVFDDLPSRPTFELTSEPPKLGETFDAAAERAADEFCRAADIERTKLLKRLGRK